MQQLQLEITLADGQTLPARLRAEDERRLADLLGDRSTIELASRDDDLEGHALSSDVLVDVEGHAVAIRLPTAADAAAVRRALAVAALTATVVGAGAIAALQSPSTASVVQAPPAADNVRTVPAPALRAEEAELQRQQQNPIVAPAQAVPLDVDNPAVPAQALRAGQADQAQGQAQATSLLDEDNPLVPEQALRAQRAELERQK